MARSRVLKMTLATLALAATYGGVVGYAWHELARDEHGNRRALVTEATRRVAPLWPRFADLYQREAPPDATPIPVGDPMPTLRRMVRSPVVATAFAVSKDFELTLLRRGKASRVIDLKTWRPDTLQFRSFSLGMVLLKERNHGQPRPLNAIYPTPHDDQFIYELLDVLDFGDRDRFLNVSHTSFSAMMKFDPRRGVLGYVTRGELAERFKAMARAVGVEADVDLAPEAMALSYRSELAPPAGFEPPMGLRFLRLYTEDRHLWADDVDIVGRAFWALGVLLAGCVLATSAFARALKGLLDDRAIARAQSDFTSAVSHEMRTPLATIRLYAEMLEQDLVTEPEARRSYLRTIGTETDRLGRLIENVLDFAAIGRGRKVYDLVPLAARVVLDEAVAATAGMAAAAGATVRVSAPDGLWAKGDRDALVQALVNLVGNAVKYAGGTIDVSAERVGDRVVFSVSDRGRGIPKREQKRIFRPFYRIGSELTRTTQGTGLGLALVEATAKAHGGSVTVADRPGGGTVFQLAIEAASAPREEAAA